MQAHSAGAGGLGADPRVPAHSPRNLSTDSDFDFQGFMPARTPPGAARTSTAVPLNGIAGSGGPAGASMATSDHMSLMLTLALELHNRLSGEEAVSVLQAKQLSALMETSGALHRRVEALEQGMRTEVDTLRGEAAVAGAAARQAGAAASLLHGRVAAAEQEAARAKAALLTAQCEIRALTGTVMQLVSVAESHAAALRRGSPGTPLTAVQRQHEETNWDPQISGNSDHGDGEVPIAAAI